MGERFSNNNMYPTNFLITKNKILFRLHLESILIRTDEKPSVSDKLMLALKEVDFYLIVF